MTFLDVEFAKDLEVWPPVPEIIQIPKTKVMSELLIGRFSSSSLRKYGLCT